MHAAALTHTCGDVDACSGVDARMQWRQYTHAAALTLACGGVDARMKHSIHIQTYTSELQRPAATSEHVVVSHSQDSAFPFWIVAHADADIYDMLTVYLHTHSLTHTHTHTHTHSHTHTHACMHKCIYTVLLTHRRMNRKQPKQTLGSTSHCGSREAISQHDMKHD